VHGWQVEARTTSRPKPKKQGDQIMDAEYRNYLLVCQDDPNVFEKLESQVYLEALEEALEMLGWMIVVEADED